MIKVVAKSTVKADKIEEFRTLASELIDETRKEKGVIVYELYQDISNPSIFTFIEAWENQRALEEHFNSPHFKEIVPQFGPLRESQAEINVYHLIK